MSEREHPSAVGRPRCEESHAAILRAASQLLEEVGFARLSIEGIAVRAGVGKATIYRWWSCKGAVAMEAFLSATEQKVIFPQTGSAIADVTAQMCVLAEAYQGVTGRIVGEVIALGQSDPDSRKAFVEGYLEPRRSAARIALQRGVEQGEIRTDVDLDILVDALYAPIINRLLLRPGSLNESFVKELASLVFNGVKTKKLALRKRETQLRKRRASPKGLRPHLQ